MIISNIVMNIHMQVWIFVTTIIYLGLLTLQENADETCRFDGLSSSLDGPVGLGFSKIVIGRLSEPGVRASGANSGFYSNLFLQELLLVPHLQ